MKFLKIEPMERGLFLLTLDSGNDEYKGCKLKFMGLGKSISLSLPQFIKPFEKRTVAKGWDAETIKRMGRDYYSEFFSKEYGITHMDGFVSIKYGVQTWSSEDTKSYSFFLPWTQNTFIRRTIFNADGTFYANFPHTKGYFLGKPDGTSEWDKEYKASQTVSKVHYAFLDYDFEEIVASCYIEEREWHKGESWCSWLKYFNKPLIIRSLDLAFSSEVGNRKNSWKGGTLATSINMLENELPLDAFLRFCAKKNLRFVDIVEAPPEKIKVVVPAGKVDTSATPVLAI